MIFGWSGLAAMLTLQGVIVLALWDTAVGMVLIWERSGTYTHAFAVLPIVLWLVWRQRDALKSLSAAPSWSAALLLLPLSGFWLLGELASVNAATHLALVGMLVVAVPATLGWGVAQALAFPLAFSFFMVPVGDFMMPSMMTWTAEFTVWALRLTGVPVYQEGLRFVIPTGSWSVVEACSGIRYLIASLTVGALFAYITYTNNRKRWLFMLVALLVPIVANWLRAYLIVMLGHLSGNKLAAGADHLVYGWFFFGLVVMLMFWIGSRWADNPIAARAIEPAPPSGPAERDGTRFGLAATPNPKALVTSAALLAGIAFALVGPVVESVAAGAVKSSPITAAQLAPPIDHRLGRADDWKPVFEGANASWQGWISRPGGEVGLHIAAYRAQTKDRKLLGSTNVIVRPDDSRWAPIGALNRSSVNASGIGSVPIRVQLVQETNEGGAAGQGRRQLLVWQVFLVDGAAVSDGVPGRLAAAAGRLAGRGDDAFGITLHTEITAQGSDSAHRMIEAALREVLPGLTGQLQSLR